MTCKAALNIAGEHFGCDRTDESHSIHSNTPSEAIWVSHDEAERLPDATRQNTDEDTERRAPCPDCSCCEAEDCEAFLCMDCPCHQPRENAEHEAGCQCIDLRDPCAGAPGDPPAPPPPKNADSGGDRG